MRRSPVRGEITRSDLVGISILSLVGAGFASYFAWIVSTGTFQVDLEIEVAFFAVAGFLVFVMVEGIVIFLGELAWSWVIRCRSPRYAQFRRPIVAMILAARFRRPGSG